ncbi:hypothetical protein TEA_004687 [Camellia sinensis var. sinensis]|uniref:Uncharacterized protein n=1 Tax=Camellia sinensis var. sinensis TaxID=542762 RepID=A0A4S4F4N6_CAMSN|nr:hypothetical protein TEA_004687 [Camellia sinensis var. sinensis]
MEEEVEEVWIEGEESAKAMLERVLRERPLLLLLPPLHRVPLRFGNVVELLGPSPSAKTHILIQNHFSFMIMEQCQNYNLHDTGGDMIAPLEMSIIFVELWATEKFNKKQPVEVVGIMVSVERMQIFSNEIYEQVLIGDKITLDAYVALYGSPIKHYWIRIGLDVPETPVIFCLECFDVAQFCYYVYVDCLILVPRFIAAVSCILPKEWNGVTYGGLEHLVMFIDLDCRFDVLRLSQSLRHRIMEANATVSSSCFLLECRQSPSSPLFHLIAPPSQPRPPETTYPTLYTPWQAALVLPRVLLAAD